jgi:outer membrane protein OmpA-like peptidoglycan-associated protein
MLSGLKLTPFADNALFYGLTGAKAHYEALFSSAFAIWRKKGVISKVVEPMAWADPRFVAALAPDYPNEKVVENFKFDKAPKASERGIVNKSLSIHFMTGSDEIMEGSYFVLDALGETMTSFGNTFLQIEGNTDSRGSAATNLTLSQRRAEAVRKYLVKNFQLPDARFVTKGYGDTRPVASNKDEDGRAMNRRTDIKVVLNAQ